MCSETHNFIGLKFSEQFEVLGFYGIQTRGKNGEGLKTRIACNFFSVVCVCWYLCFSEDCF